MVSAGTTVTAPNSQSGPFQAVPGSVQPGMTMSPCDPAVAPNKVGDKTTDQC